MAALVLIAAGASDVLDGWYARRFGQATPTGALLDPVMDKIFVGTVLVVLLTAHRLALVEALLLGTRELGVLAIGAFLMLRSQNLWRSHPPRPLGKLTTALQYAAALAAVARSKDVAVFALAAGFAARSRRWRIGATSAVALRGSADADGLELALHERRRRSGAMKERKPKTARARAATQRRRHEVEGLAAGAVAGAALGSIAGPPGAIVGAVLGGLVGAVGGVVMDEAAVDRLVIDRRLDAEIGVSGGELGAPNLLHPPSVRGTFSPASSGAGESSGSAPAEGPAQAPE